MVRMKNSFASLIILKSQLQIQNVTRYTKAEPKFNNEKNREED